MLVTRLMMRASPFWYSTWFCRFAFCPACHCVPLFHALTISCPRELCKLFFAEIEGGSNLLKGSRAELREGLGEANLRRLELLQARPLPGQQLPDGLALRPLLSLLADLLASGLELEAAAAALREVGAVP